MVSHLGYKNTVRKGVKSFAEVKVLPLYPQIQTFCHRRQSDWSSSWQTHADSCSSHHESWEAAWSKGWAWWCSCLGTNTIVKVSAVFLRSHFNTWKVSRISKSSLPLMPILIVLGAFSWQCLWLHNQLRMKHYQLSVGERKLAKKWFTQHHTTCLLSSRSRTRDVLPSGHILIPRFITY